MECAITAGVMPDSFVDLDSPDRSSAQKGSVQREFVGCMLMPHFTPNKSVRFQGRMTRVEHVVIRDGSLMVKLAGFAEAIHGEHIDVEPSKFVYRSQVGAT